jgi:hypothetical protein
VAGFDDALHDQGGAGAQDARQGEPLVIELPVSRQVTDDDAEEVVWVAEQALRLALLLFLALLPQFVTRGAAWPFAAQIAPLLLVERLLA